LKSQKVKNTIAIFFILLVFLDRQLFVMKMRLRYKYNFLKESAKYRVKRAKNRMRHLLAQRFFYCFSYIPRWYFDEKNYDQGYF